ncbi:hypothetical protein [uncultured Variovorax sp.]|uniref:hypothetical protein n=1 Tax=uncultured Variovorax sp. TaxID=114708 RepID=UPI0025EDAFF5|nr:hypothetical protein [uncultured Variovorax sp.]
MTRRERNSRLKCLDPYAELSDLISSWVRHDLHAATGGLGYPSHSLNFDRVQVHASSIDPTGYCARDHSLVAASVNALAATDGNLFAALAMYYKPWMIESLKDRGFPMAPSQTFYDRLVRAHAWVQSTMDAKRTRVDERSVALG